MAAKSIPLARFMNSEFKAFSMADNVRSIPSICDGFKNSQRKAMYGMVLRGENAPELQVERLASQIAAATDYHHGAGSLAGVLVGLASDYTGTNNFNLLIPSGQFGSRLTKEAASPRYIFTKLHSHFRELFKKEDDLILEHHIVNGEKFEPIEYLPILPVILINGGQGTGTGHACVVMNYNPNDVKRAVQQAMNKKPITPLVPWYKGFKGTIVRNGNQTVITGCLEVVNTTTIRITELPVGMYLDPYKATLDKLVDASFIKDYEDSSTEESFDFKVTCPRTTTLLDEDVLLQKFKLISRDTENLTMWNPDGCLQKFGSVEEVIQTFVDWRIGKYEVRRQKLMSILKDEIAWLTEKMRFINFYLANHEKFRNAPKKELIELLLANDFVRYNELLSMPIWSLTKDRILDLMKEHDGKVAELCVLEAVTADHMYNNELRQFKYEEK